jgi:hypothetical protein
MELPKRRPNRMPSYDYSSNGYYFITICVKNKEKLLCRVVGGGAKRDVEGAVPYGGSKFKAFPYGFYL